MTLESQLFGTQISRESGAVHHTKLIRRLGGPHATSHALEAVVLDGGAVASIRRTNQFKLLARNERSLTGMDVPYGNQRRSELCSYDWSIEMQDFCMSMHPALSRTLSL
jgi:hypothetical protein